MQCTIKNAVNQSELHKSVMKMNKVQRIIQSINSVQDVAQERTQIRPKTLQHGTNSVINVVGITSQICVEPGKEKKTPRTAVRSQR